MSTKFIAATDGAQIAYDKAGAGPALVLLHGGGGSRQEWFEAGYVSRLKDHYAVIAPDLRGHGDSALPTDPEDYTLDKMAVDILAVVDACGFERFNLWAMSYGAKIGRHLAVHSERVDRTILMGAQMGLGVSGDLRQAAVDFCAHWPPILEAQRAGSLDLDSLSQNDRDLLAHLNVPVMLGWVRAMLDWPAIEPADFLCPTLWLAGSEDQNAMASIQEYQHALDGSQVQVQIVDGLDHNQLFDEIDRVLPIMLAFMG
jgi:pimeloyl-ACP methyl ester carboxylesterase